MKVDERKRLILGAVVDEYIRTGEPVGSNAVLSILNINISSATIRNDMSYLEGAGLLEQPHTSAGRIPTYLGLRYYIQHLMTPKPLSDREKAMIDGLLDHDVLTADSVVEHASNVLGELTNLAVISKSSMPVFSVITRVEVIPAGRRLYALLVITSSGAVKNKICRLQFDLTYEQLHSFERFINENLQGINVGSISPEMLQNLALALGSYITVLSPLICAVSDISKELATENVDMTGEQNLLADETLRSDEVVSLMTHKNQLSRLLSSAMDGISVVFGKEQEGFAVTNSSLVISSYKARHQSLGALGVIGPVRIDYAKVIPYLEYITDNMTRMISDVFLDDESDAGKEASDGKGNEDPGEGNEDPGKGK